MAFTVYRMVAVEKSETYNHKVYIFDTIKSYLAILFRQTNKQAGRNATLWREFSKQKQKKIKCNDDAYGCETISGKKKG